MKAAKVFIPVVLVVILALGWFMDFRGVVETRTSQNDFEAEAERSVENGLYAQAVELYKSAAKYGDVENAYRDIREAYELYYSEEPTVDVREGYLADMLEATRACPAVAEFWETACELYLEDENYAKAYGVVSDAERRGAHSDKLTSLKLDLQYKVRADYKLYPEAKTALNGFISVSDGHEWFLLDGLGKQLKSGYRLIGLINDEGEGIYVNDIDARLIDKEGVARGRFDLSLVNAGCYDANTGLVPVEIDGVGWAYLDAMTGELRDGRYKLAGAYSDGIAAVCSDDGWHVIDVDGKLSDRAFDDIALDEYGRCVWSGIVFAKDEDRFKSFDTSLLETGIFECDDVDLCSHGKTFAFQEGDSWGFADSAGSVTVSPEYTSAKAYSHGLAAVKNSHNQWGFVDEENRVVIDFEYSDAGYFNSDSCCLVKIASESWQIVRLLFS